MNAKLKRLAGFAVFLILLLTSLFMINRILEPKYTLSNSSWPTTSTYNQFYRMEKDTVDVLFFGSSVAASTFVPQVIYDEYGITSYNLASEQQSIFLSYYWLMEALRFQSPKVVVVDLEFMEDYHPESPINTRETITRKSIDPMKWSLVKLKAIRNICRMDSSQSLLSYFLTNIRFHSRWEDLSPDDFDRKMSTSAPLKGYAPIAEKGPDTYEPFLPGQGGTKHEFQNLMQEYLDRIVELCSDQGIELMLVNLPGATMDDSINFTHETYAKEYGVTYINLCLPQHIEAIGAKLPEENIVYHENIWGAIKTSRYIGRLLQDNYEIPPRKDEAYEDSGKFFEEVLDSFNLTRIEDAGEYKNALAKPYFKVYESEGTTITVLGKDYTPSHSGQNTVVFDTNIERVVDHVTIYGENVIRYKLELD
ncbi:MAG: hypothetical protein K6E91_06905 [Butyrivibrio sp.]|nr:hypothetical protein [Butyrivibrio sp.]